MVGSAILAGGLVWLAISDGADWPGWFLSVVGVIWLATARRRSG